MPIRRRGAPGAPVVIVVAAALGACSSHPSHPTPPPVEQTQPGTLTILEGSPLRSTLVFDTVRTAERSEAVIATGSVESDPVRTVHVLPPLTGRVVAVHVHLGDAVGKGDSLVTLDSPDFTSAQADYSRALSAFRQASNNLTRERDLAQYGIAAQRDVDQAQTDFAQAEGDLRRAVAHLSLLGADTNTPPGQQRLVVRSPIAGRVTDLAVGVGEFRNDPTVPMMTVADLSTVYLTANVPEKDVHAVQIGERAMAILSAYPSDTVRGVVSMVGAVVDTATRTTKARVLVANPDGHLKPGMYGTVTFATHSRPVLVVPTTALLQVGDSDYAFVEPKPWTLERRAVTVGTIDGGWAVIREGLVLGERLVVRQVVLLQ